MDPGARSAPEEAASAFEPLRDVLLQGRFVMAAGLEVPTQRYEFAVEREYGMLRFDLAGAQGAGWVAALRNFRLLDPEGREVVSAKGRDYEYAFPSALGDRPFTLATHARPIVGTYRMVFEGVSSPFDFTVLGLTDVAADFLLSDVLGKGQVRLWDLRGKVVLVETFHEWCEPCREEVHSLAPLYDEFPREAFEILLVDLAQAPEGDLRSLATRYGWTFWVGGDDGTVKPNYGGSKLTSFTIVDQDGLLAWRHDGFAVDPETVRGVVAGLLANE